MTTPMTTRRSARLATDTPLASQAPLESLAPSARTPGRRGSRTPAAAGGSTPAAQLLRAGRAMASSPCATPGKSLLAGTDENAVPSSPSMHLLHKVLGAARERASDSPAAHTPAKSSSGTPRAVLGQLSQPNTPTPAARTPLALHVTPQAKTPTAAAATPSSFAATPNSSALRVRSDAPATEKPARRTGAPSLRGTQSAVKSAQPEPVRRSSRRGAAPDAAIVDAVVRRTLRTVEVPAEVPVAVAEAVVEEEAAAVATLVAAAVERVVDDAASVEAAAEAALIVEAAAEAEVAVEAAAVAEAISYSAAVKSPSVRQLKKQLKEAHVEERGRWDMLGATHETMAAAAAGGSPRHAMLSAVSATLEADQQCASTQRDAWMAGRKAERALAAKEKRRDARRGRVTAPEPATPEQQLAGSPMMMMEAAGKTLHIRGQVDPCGTHLRFDAVTGAASMVPGVAPTPYQSPVMAEESFCGAEEDWEVEEAWGEEDAEVEEINAGPVHLPRRTPLKGLKASEGCHLRFDDEGEAVESPTNGALRMRGMAVACGTRTVFSP